MSRFEIIGNEADQEDVAQCIRCSAAAVPESEYCEDCKEKMEGDDD